MWQQPYGGADKTVDVHLSWLRRKLGETAAAPRMLHSVRGVGVKLLSGAPTGADARTGSVRRRLALLVAATTSVVLLAFLVPLAVLVGRAAASDAVNDATSRTQPLVVGRRRRRSATRRGRVDRRRPVDDPACRFASSTRPGYPSARR